MNSSVLTNGKIKIIKSKAFSFTNCLVVRPLTAYHFNASSMIRAAQTVQENISKVMYNELGSAAYVSKKNIGTVIMAAADIFLSYFSIYFSIFFFIFLFSSSAEALCVGGFFTF